MSIPASQTPHTEPWLRGTHDDVPAAGRAVLHALELAQDDLEKWTEGLSDGEMHAQPLGLTSIAQQFRHIAGSIDRILTYAEGNQLSADQLAAMKAEGAGAETSVELLVRVRESLARAARRVRALATADLSVPRSVGRKQLPTSLGGALIHVADHTQRHVGQVVTTAKVIKALRG
ncbi:MAG: DinB family protein [Acidobacteriota bacterium]